MFNPGDKVIKTDETDPNKYGHVMDIPPIQQKPGYVAVYFNRRVWIKQENIMLFDDWQEKRRAIYKTAKSIKNYWTPASATTASPEQQRIAQLEKRIDELARHVKKQEELLHRWQGLASSATVYFGHHSPEWSAERAELDQETLELGLKSVDFTFYTKYKVNK